MTPTLRRLAATRSAQLVLCVAVLLSLLPKLSRRRDAAQTGRQLPVVSIEHHSHPLAFAIWQTARCPILMSPDLDFALLLQGSATILEDSKNPVGHDRPVVRPNLIVDLSRVGGRIGVRIERDGVAVASGRRRWCHGKRDDSSNEERRSSAAHVQATAPQPSVTVARASPAFRAIRRRLSALVIVHPLAWSFSPRLYLVAITP